MWKTNEKIFQKNKRDNIYFVGICIYMKVRNQKEVKQMLTILISTQIITTGLASAYIIYNLTKQKYTKLKLINKCNKTGFKHYKHY